MKANHNYSLKEPISTLLFIKSKIQFFESKSQHPNAGATNESGCLSSQRYNFLKANHNKKIGRPIKACVVYQVKDTIFWKQITTLLALPIRLNGCLSSQRYNFLKANHNNFSKMKRVIFVVYQVKDTIFWKQITTLIVGFRSLICCLSSQRYNFLKANHNDVSFGWTNW